ncbi:MAG: hypothetical protein KDK56_03310 [Simkania sp.]|nr:hypothetical protein [Simkania sp.]MCB1075743.1 hypothetical protein [Simkania sp.]MCP5490926.1 hypothetical protein [Chlamydiales bacterium]
MKKAFLSSLLLGSLFLVGCSVRQGSEEVAFCSSHDVHNDILDGQTTKQQVFERFGTIFAIHFDELGREQWKYSYCKKGLNNQTFQAKTLLVVFDENDVVTKHYFHRYEDQIKMGL